MQEPDCQMMNESEAITVIDELFWNWQNLMLMFIIQPNASRAV